MFFNKKVKLGYVVCAQIAYRIKQIKRRSVKMMIMPLCENCNSQTLRK